MTPGAAFIARLAVPTETPALRATSLMVIFLAVTLVFLRPSVLPLLPSLIMAKRSGNV